MPITRAQDREMILNPRNWPLLSLPLKRKGGEVATFYQPVSVMKVDGTKPITIHLGSMFQNPTELETKEYQDVDALLDDGWVVD